MTAISREYGMAKLKQQDGHAETGELCGAAGIARTHGGGMELAGGDLLHDLVR
jgi:hypothetical protein